MHSFIFNSKNSFIVKVILAGFCLAVVYFSLVGLLPKKLKGTTQWQTNIIKAQEYAFNQENYDIVVVGSSEMYNVPIEKLSSKYYNCAFASGCSNTGLQLIQEKGCKPKVVIVELNDTLVRAIDNDLLNRCRGWHKWSFARENSRPDYILWNVAPLIKQKIKSLKGRIKPPQKKLDGPTNQMELQRRLQASQNSPTSENMDAIKASLVDISERISELQKAGVRVILVEPPNAVELYDTVAYNEIRSLVRGVFPINKYEWIDVDWGKYTTGDGIHLQPASAERYAMDLVEKIKM